MRSTARVIKFAAQGFRRNVWLSVITTSIMVLALFSVNILLGLNILAKEAISSVEKRIDVSVYFKQDASEQVVGEAKSYLLSLPHVRSVEVTTSEEALERLKARHADNTIISESVATLEENPLGASLSVKARSPEDFPAILTALENPTFASAIAEKNYDDHRRVIERIQSIAGKVERGAIVISIVFTAIAALIVFNSIRIAIYTHREEIGIMRLVGASNWFIRTPFIIESMFYSLLAGTIAIVVLFPVLSLVGPSISNFFDGTSFNIFEYFRQNAFWIFGSELLGAAILSVVASSVAVGKYLKV